MYGYIRYSDKLGTYNSYFTGINEFESSLKFVTNGYNGFEIKEIVLASGNMTRQPFIAVMKKYCFIIKQEYFQCDDTTLIKRTKDRINTTKESLEKMGVKVTPITNYPNREGIRCLKFKVVAMNSNYKNSVNYDYLADKFKNKENFNESLDRALDQMTKSIDKGMLQVDRAMEKLDREMNDLENCFTDEDLGYTRKSFLGSRNSNRNNINNFSNDKVRKEVQWILDDSFKPKAPSFCKPKKPTWKERWQAFKKRLRTKMIKIYLQSEKEVK